MFVFAFDWKELQKLSVSKPIFCIKTLVYNLQKRTKLSNMIF